MGGGRTARSPALFVDRFWPRVGVRRERAVVGRAGQAGEAGNACVRELDVVVNMSPTTTLGSERAPLSGRGGGAGPLAGGAVAQLFCRPTSPEPAGPQQPLPHTQKTHTKNEPAHAARIERRTLRGEQAAPHAIDKNRTALLGAIFELLLYEHRATPPGEGSATKKRHWWARLIFLVFQEADKTRAERPQLVCWCRQHRSERPVSQEQLRPQLCAKPAHRRLAAR
jgi:hypothetical protein